MDWPYEEKSIFGDEVILDFEGEECNVYLYKMQGTVSKMVLFQLFPGLYIIFNDIRAQSLMQKVDLYENISSFEYCLSGSYEVELSDGRVLYISEGDALYHSFGEQVVFSTLPTKKYRGVTILLDFQEDFSELETFLTVCGLTSDDLVQLFKEGQKDSVVSPTYDLKKIFSDLYVTNVVDKVRYYRLKVTEIFLLMLEGQKESETSNFQLTLLEHIVEHMQRDIATTLSIKQLAKEHGVSLTSLNNYFKETYHMTPYQYLKKLRLQVASKMLKTSQAPVTEIASNIGFQNPSKFAIAFKSQYSMSPTDYRKKYFWS